MTNGNYSEKVSVNINTSTLSNIDILVDNGYYSNRSDFINQALRDGLQKHQDTLNRIIDRQMEKGAPNHWFVGVYALENDELEAAEKQGQRLSYTGYGVLAIDKRVDEKLLFRVVQHIRIKGKVICSQAIKDHYGLK